jgi:hypothetical protein
MSAGAGYYSNGRGYLPWSAAVGAVDKYRVYRIK